MAPSTASIISAAVIAALAFAGLCAAQRVFEPDATHHYITIVYYYTNLGNVLVGLYFVCYCLFAWTGVSALAWTCAPGAQLAVVCAITVVLLVFHFILWGGRPANWGKCMARLHSRSAEAILMHYAVPLATIAWWFAFANHAGLAWYHALMWLIVPGVYLIFLVIFAKLHGPIGRRKTAWPYDFLDMDKLGLRRWLVNVIGVACAFAALGFTFFGINCLIF